MILQTSFSALLVGLNYNNPDYLNYELAFNNAYGRLTEFDLFNVLDIGTKSILLVGNEIGINNYGDFRLIYSIILFFIFGITIRKTCKYGAICLTLYMVSYIFLDEVQFRNFSSFVILLPFLIYYIKNQNKKGLIIFLIGDFLAFTLHFSAVFYLLFGLTIVKSKSLKITYIAIAILFIGAISAIESNIAMIDHTSHYEAPSIVGGVVSCFLLVCNYWFINYINNNYLLKKKDVCSLSIYKYFHIIVQINLLLLILCPVIFINATILRILRFISIVNIIFILNLATDHNKRKISNKLICYSLIYSLIIGYWFNRSTGVYESIFNNPLF